MLAQVYDRQVSHSLGREGGRRGLSLHASEDDHEDEGDQKADVEGEIGVERPRIPFELRVSDKSIVKEDQRQSCEA